MTNMKKHQNKICAVIGIIAGILGVMILDDATALVCSLIFGIPLFFTRSKVY